MANLTTLKRRALRAFRLGLKEYDSLMDEIAVYYKRDADWEKFCEWLDEHDTSNFPLTEREIRAKARYERAETIAWAEQQQNNLNRIFEGIYGKNTQ